MTFLHTQAKSLFSKLKLPFKDHQQTELPPFDISFVAPLALFLLIGVRSHRALLHHEKKKPFRCQIKPSQIHMKSADIVIPKKPKPPGPSLRPPCGCNPYCCVSLFLGGDSRVRKTAAVVERAPVVMNMLTQNCTWTERTLGALVEGVKNKKFFFLVRGLSL